MYATVGVTGKPVVSKRDARARKARRRAVWGWTASLLLHGGIAALGLGALGGQALIAGARGAGDKGDMVVMLVRPSALAAAAASEAQAGGLQPLFAKFDTGAAPVERDLKPGPDMGQLLQRLATQAAADPDRRLRDALRADAELDSLAAGAKGATDPNAPAGGGSDLWGVVAPCWKGLAQDSAAPVVLEVTLDARGVVSTPPQIVRSAGVAVNERQLRAEALALTALSSCMARAEPRFGGHIYRLNFLPPRR